jgi:hypothetical protein
MYLVAIFGVAAFAQPAIGKAFLAGHHDVIGLNSSVYDTALNVTSAVGLVLWVAGGVLFAVAISRSQSLPTAAGVLLAVGIPVFAIASIMGNVLAQIGGLLQIGSTIWIARSAMTSRSDSPSTLATLDQEPPVPASLDVGQTRTRGRGPMRSAQASDRALKMLRPASR